MEEAEEPADQVAGGGSPGDIHTAQRATASPDQTAIPRSRP